MEEGFIYLPITYLLSVIALIVFLYLSGSVLYDVLKKQEIKAKIIKFVLIVFCAAGIILSIPLWFWGLSISTKSEKQMELYAKLAVQASIIPAEKSFMYENLGDMYFLSLSLKDGNKAIEAYEKANSPFVNGRLCSLYTIKGDTQKAIDKCNLAERYQLLAVNYILQDNYTEALTQINKKVESNNERKTAMDYATRGFIYKKLNQTEKAQKDFEQAISMTKNSKNIKEISTNDNYFKELYAKRKSEYKF